MDYRALADRHASRIIELRRDFHAHPELSYREVRTSQAVCDELERLHIPFTRLAENCVVGVLKGGKSGPDSLRLAIRADMDALPVTEEVDGPFKSTNEGVMHACGHDGHTAMLLGAAAMLAEHRAQLAGTVYLCFQSAEEVRGGAQTVIGHLKALGGADRAIAAHLWADLDSGKLSVVEGARMAGGDTFTIEVTGQGGHASRPDLSIDPIKPLCQIALTISAIPTNRIRTIEPCVVHVGRIDAGTIANVFPQSAKLYGGYRVFSAHSRERLPQLLEEVATGIAAAWGATATVTVEAGVPEVYNDAASVALAQQVLEQSGLFEPDAFEPICASENFSLFLEAFGGFLCFIGIRNEEKGLTYTQHHPRFGIDEDVLGRGAAFFAAYAMAYLDGQ